MNKKRGGLQPVRRMGRAQRATQKKIFEAIQGLEKSQDSINRLLRLNRNLVSVS